MPNCHTTRQGDEYFCPRCSLRWGIDEDKPTCVTTPTVEERIATAVAAERELCAIEADRVLIKGRTSIHSEFKSGWNQACHDAAQRIRERK